MKMKIWGTFFDQHFFSKIFPMEKSMKNENCDFSGKINTRRGFTVISVGGNGHFFMRRVVRFSELGMTHIHVIGFQKTLLDLGKHF